MALDRTAHTATSNLMFAYDRAIIRLMDRTAGELSFRCLLIAGLLSLVLASGCSPRKDSADHYSLRLPRKAVEVPTQRAGEHVFVQAKMNGAGPYWFLLDSGSQIGVITEDLAREAGLKLKGYVAVVHEVGGTATNKMYEGAAFDLGGAIYKASSVAARPRETFRRMERLHGRRFDGVIGHGLFLCSVLELDYQKRILRLRRRLPADSQMPPLQLSSAQEGPILTTSVMLPGGKVVKGRFLIDTGSNSAVDLIEDYVERQHLVFGQQVEGESTSLSGSLRIKQIVLDKFIFGPFSFEKVPAGITPAKFTFDGIIGNRVLSKFTVVFDYDHSRVWLRPNTSFNEPFDRNTSGLLLSADGPQFDKIQVEFVRPNSSAMAAGLHRGDVLVSIDGKASETLTLDSVRELLKQKGRNFELKVGRGQEVLGITLRATTSPE